MIPWQELQKMVAGELSTADSDLRSHSEDASIFSVRPLAVLYPKSKQDVAAALAFCRKERVPFLAWGAGTSRGGQPLGKGLIVNFARHMNRILGFDTATGSLRVEPGATYAQVQKYLAPLGRSFPPDPSFHACTIGGMVANNAAGIHSVKYGGTIKHVVDAEYVNVRGEFAHASAASPERDRAAALLEQNWNFVSEDFPKVEKNSAGYAFHEAFSSDTGKLDLAKLFTGSEGTLAPLTEITLNTVPLQPHRVLLVGYFPSLTQALRGALLLKKFSVAACELVDKVLLDLHAEATHQAPGPKHAKQIKRNPYLDLFYELRSEAVLIAEFEGASQAECLALLAPAAQALKEARLAKTVDTVTGAEEQALVWDLRRHTSPILNKLEDGKISIKPLWAVEDVCLPPDRFEEYVEQQQRIFQKHGLVCSFFGHAASANLHIDPVSVDPRKALQDEAVAKLYDEVARESYALVIRLGGSISGEHGDGLLRTPYLKAQYPKSYPLFAEIKKIFDPEGILNPGKIVEQTWA